MGRGYERNYRTDIQLRSEYYVVCTDATGRSFAIRRGDDIIVHLKSGVPYRGTVWKVGTKHLLLKTEAGTVQVQWDSPKIVDSIDLIHSR